MRLVSPPISRGEGEAQLVEQARLGELPVQAGTALGQDYSESARPERLERRGEVDVALACGARKSWFVGPCGCVRVTRLSLRWARARMFGCGHFSSEKT
jgi:hypothetical protein